MKNFKSKEGFGLVDVIIVSGVCLLGIYLMTTVSNQLSQRNRNIELSGELQSIRLKVRNNLDCRETLKYSGEAAAACDGSDIKLVDKQGEEMFKTQEDGTIIGTSSYQIRARCLNAADGMIIEYKRGKKEKNFKDPLWGREQDWHNLFDSKGVWKKDWASLFHRSQKGFFCQNAFGVSASALDCSDDEIMIGVGQNGEPECEKVWSRVSFKACIQFSDASCNTQNGPVSCTPCSGEFSTRPNDLLASPSWAFDASKTNLDCAKVFLQRCDGIDLDPPPASDPIVPYQAVKRGLFNPDINQRSAITTGDCAAQCKGNEVMVGYNRYTESYCSSPCLTGCCGYSLRHACNWACQTIDEDRNAEGLVSADPGDLSIACPPPIGAGLVINPGGDKCTAKDGCIDKLMAARDLLVDLASKRFPNPNSVPPRIRNLQDKKKLAKKAGGKIFQQIKSAAAALQCDPLPGAIYRRKNKKK